MRLAALAALVLLGGCDRTPAPATADEAAIAQAERRAIENVDAANAAAAQREAAPVTAGPGGTK